MNKHILRFFGICLIFLFFNKETGLSQSIPVNSFDRQSDFSYMWWLNTIKKENKIFGIKTSSYSLSFDYGNLTIPNFTVNNSQTSEGKVLRESNGESFAPNNSCNISFGMTSEARTYKVQAYAQDIDDCQLIETGKYFHRRFINNLVDLNGCNLYSSGLEISSWPDRIAFILKATPNINLENRGLYIDFTFPQAYSELLDKGDIMALRNPDDGSGFIILKSEKTTNLLVTGTKVTANLEKLASIPAGYEISVGLIIYPVTENIEAELKIITELENHPVTVTAQQVAPLQEPLDVSFDRDQGWHHIALRNDGNTSEYAESSNSRIERVKLVFDNPSSVDKVVRLNFAKGRLSENKGSVFGITGISAILRDTEGYPLGIPVQLSKNWHTSESQSEQYFRGPWYHGLCMLDIPADTKLEIEYTSVNALWGGVPAASHAQLCLVGWGSNQQWDQSAIGSWGESITYEPDLDQAGAPVLDFRPLMIRDLKNQTWGWTGNMGGADFFNYTKLSGTRSWHSRMRTQYIRCGPNLTEVTYAGTMDDNSMDFEYTASIGRSDDIIRGIYHIKLRVRKNTDFKDFVFFQVAAPTYHYTKSNTLAWGNETGLKKQWDATIGGNSRYITAKQEALGDIPWFSFTNSGFTSPEPNFRPANRGFIIRSWTARINGTDSVPPWFAEYNATGGHGGSSGLINITPPANCTSFQAGDSIEATIVLFQIPKNTDDYYGPNQKLIAALVNKSNSWEMVYREAIGNDLEVIVSEEGSLIHNYPIKIEATNSNLAFKVTGGHGYIPLTITNVGSFKNPILYKKVNASWQKVNQSVYGNDFWQTEYNIDNNTWDITYNIDLDTPNDERQTAEFKFESNTVTNTLLPESNSDSGWKIYPNPTMNGTFNVEIHGREDQGETKVKITDLQGRLFFKKNYSWHEMLVVDSQLEEGIYLVSLKNSKLANTQKLVIQ